MVETLSLVARRGLGLAAAAPCARGDGWAGGGASCHWLLSERAGTRARLPLAAWLKAAPSSRPNPKFSLPPSHSAAEEAMGWLAGPSWAGRGLRVGLAVAAAALLIQALRSWASSGRRFEFDPEEIARIGKHHAGSSAPPPRRASLRRRSLPQGRRGEGTGRSAPCRAREGPPEAPASL